MFIIFFYWALGYEERDRKNARIENYIKFWDDNMYISDEIVKGLNENKKTFYSYCEISKENNIKSFSKNLKTYYYTNSRGFKDSIEYTYSISTSIVNGDDITRESIEIKHYNDHIDIEKDNLEEFLTALNKAKERRINEEIAENEIKKEEERIESLYD